VVALLVIGGGEGGAMIDQPTLTRRCDVRRVNSVIFFFFISHNKTWKHVMGRKTNHKKHAKMGNTRNNNNNNKQKQ
jgi:hypothetical protein